MESRSIQVPASLAGERADVALSRLLGFSRTYSAEVIDSGGLEVAGKVLRKSELLTEGALLSVTWQPKSEAEIVPEDITALSVVHLDDDLVVIDKPAGVASHPSLGWEGPSVLGVLSARGISVSGLGPAERSGIVHRLDVGTSGLMVVARSDLAYQRLKAAFKHREVEKIYRAVVQGHPDPLFGTIDAPIGRHPRSRWKFAVTADGKPSVTHFRTIEAFRSASLLEVELETGRTHQIRVHLAANHHPCVGDELYGADRKLSARLELTRQWLHAMRLGFEHPLSGDRLSFESNYPDDLSRSLEVLRRE
ncbi:MAG: RluA family pseudouridine synthase [Cryobacterium sp.]|nr:RluA family pseudouridine synthase [Cryobacterium sp.]MBX3090655.1 RluA family pseudouridine synthase [Cryobacterium sp.]MBX3116052.1 RluA family pseudouridine synthase [Cryobacterium sp.]MCO5294045.1 RluA family pseudouridine synthase [Homoserinimonas sp.]MCW5944170.1 RluA family pseudouridine synthase [Cryobacterium sp.]